MNVELDPWQVARLLANYGVRNTFLENLHADDYVRGSRINDREMRRLMLDVEKHLLKVLLHMQRCGVIQFGQTEADLLMVLDWGQVLIQGPSYDEKRA